MTARLDISHHAVERYISRVNKWATREQAMQAIREAWRGARRLHRHTSDRALYEANGGAFRMSVAERPHGRMAILSILPSHEGQEDSTIDENGEIGPPEPPHNPLRKRVIDVQDSGAWKFKPKRKDAPQPARQPAPLDFTPPPPKTQTALPKYEFKPPLSFEEARERRVQAEAHRDALALEIAAVVDERHSSVPKLRIEQQIQNNEITNLIRWIHDENTIVSQQLSGDRLRAAWSLLRQCIDFVPDHMKEAIREEVPEGFDPDSNSDDDFS